MTERIRLRLPPLLGQHVGISSTIGTSADPQGAFSSQGVSAGVQWLPLPPHPAP